MPRTATYYCLALISLDNTEACSQGPTSFQPFSGCNFEICAAFKGLEDLCFLEVFGDTVSLAASKCQGCNLRIRLSLHLNFQTLDLIKPHLESLFGIHTLRTWPYSAKKLEKSSMSDSWFCCLLPSFHSKALDCLSSLPYSDPGASQTWSVLQQEKTIHFAWASAIAR